MSRLATPFQKVCRRLGLWISESLRFASRRCCCDELTPACVACSGQVPAQMQVVLSLVATDPTPCDPGDNCDEYNATYVLDFEEADGDDCTWRYDFPATLCGLDFMRLRTEKSGANYYLWTEIFNTAETIGVAWRKYYGTSPFDCDDLTAVVVPWFGFAHGCNFAISSKCEVTSL